MAEIAIKIKYDIANSHPLPRDLPADLVQVLHGRHSEPSPWPGGQRGSESGDGSSPGRGVGKAISEEERRLDAIAKETEDLRNSSHPLPGDFPAELIGLFCALPFKYS